MESILSCGDQVGTEIERNFNMNEKKYILSDDALFELSEGAPLTEGGTLEDFLSEAEQVAEAVRKTGVNLSDLDDQGRSLFYMRAFYFLGVLRGSESYRINSMLENDLSAELPGNLPFALSDSCADLFAADLQGKPSETLKAIYKAVGLGR